MDTIEVNFEAALRDNLMALNTISFQMAELARIKEELESRVTAMLEHGDDYSKSYIVGQVKVTVSTGYNYTLDKKEYMVLGSRIPACFNPVTEKISYELNKQVIRDAEKYASAEELELLGQIISKKPKKIHVALKAAI